MADFPYTPTPASLRRFFDQLNTWGKPSKVTVKWLESVGFKSKNDRAIVGIVKSLGFTDASGTPTELWSEYRSRDQSKIVMAAALRKAYPSLFETYPDAYRKDDEALRNFFATHSTVGALAVGLMVRTFKTLAELADFAPDGGGMHVPEKVASVEKRKEAAPAALPVPDRGLTINLNIQFQLPATDDAEIYNKLFEALKKHVLA